MQKQFLRQRQREIDFGFQSTLEIGNYHIRPCLSSIQHKNLHLYRFCGQFIPSDLDYISLESIKLIMVSNQQTKVAYKLHNISGLLCWMNERYSCIWLFSLSPQYGPFHFRFKLQGSSIGKLNESRGPSNFMDTGALGPCPKLWQKELETWVMKAWLP